MSTRRRDLVFAAVVLVVAFLFHFTAFRFYDDHFVLLSNARQVLAGDHPGVDFFDQGRRLPIYLSAALLWLTGGTLLGEALLCAGALAVSTALVYWLSLSVTRSPVFSAAAAVCLLGIEPRLYNYPKVLAAVVVTWASWRFIDRPVLLRACALGASVAMAFWLRDDLGVYAAAQAGVALLFLDGSRSYRRVARDMAAAAVVTIALIAPNLWMLAAGGRFGDIASSGLSGLVSATTVTWRPFDLRGRVP